MYNCSTQSVKSVMGWHDIPGPLTTNISSDKPGAAHKGQNIPGKNSHPLVGKFLAFPTKTIA